MAIIKLVTADRAREIVDAGGRVHRDERYTGDYKYIVDVMPESLLGSLARARERERDEQ